MKFPTQVFGCSGSHTKTSSSSGIPVVIVILLMVCLELAGVPLQATSDKRSQLSSPAQLETTNTWCFSSSDIDPRYSRELTVMVAVLSPWQGSLPCDAVLPNPQPEKNLNLNMWPVCNSYLKILEETFCTSHLYVTKR